MVSKTRLLCFCLSVVIATSTANSVDRRAVSENQAECARVITNRLTDNDGTCANVAAALTRILAEENIVSQLDSLSSSVFAEFCRPSCGRQILKAWDTCNITQNYQRQVDLVTNLCGRGNNMDCFEDVAQLFSFIEAVEACQSDVEGQCSEECRTLIENSNDVFRCCVNVPIDFRTAGGEPNLPTVVDSTLDNCFERRRDPCTVIVTNPGFVSQVVNFNPSLSSEQILCIDSAIQARNDLAGECKAAASTLTAQINSDSLLSSFSKDTLALSEFCTPSCGPEIIRTWRSCNAYGDIQAEAEFLAGLCGLHQGQPCSAQYDALLLEIDDATFCAFRANGITCPTGCSSVYQDITQECCFYTFINYLNAVIDSGDQTVEERNRELFNTCGAQFPSQCLQSALNSTTTAQTTEPTAVTGSVQPSACPSSAGTILPALGVLLTALYLGLLHTQ